MPRTSNRRAAVTGRSPSLEAGSCGAPLGAFLACLNYLNGSWNTGA
jgi:hypothetical protein